MTADCPILDLCDFYHMESCDEDFYPSCNIYKRQMRKEKRELEERKELERQYELYDLGLIARLK